MSDLEICPVCEKPLPANYPMMVHSGCMAKLNEKPKGCR